MTFKRTITTTLKRYTKFPVVAVLGPRQSGKTTLVKQVFKKYVFVTLENPQLREAALQDPAYFLHAHENPHGLIIDEFQYAPQLLSYIQITVDEKKRPGYFVLTGSQNFLMNQSITQSLAGRVGIVTLLPLCQQELINNKLIKTIEETLWLGCYPRLYDEHFAPTELYPDYVHTYLERDVRQLTNVGNLRIFQKFMQLCAGRIGQLLNITDLAVSCGISKPTAEHWLSALEASYIVFLLKPYFKNFNKRLTKTPKLYFYDTGLACSLLGIESAKVLTFSPFRGALFESFILADLYKQYYNRGQQPRLYFWRDQNGRLEIDGLIEYGGKLTPLEIKAGQTINQDFFNQLRAWSELAHQDPTNGYLLYGGTFTHKRSAGTVIGWPQTSAVLGRIQKTIDATIEKS